MKVVLVRWIDATRPDDNITSGTKVGILRESVGWLLARNGSGMVIAMSRDEGDFERGFTIPKPYIKSVKVLGEA